MRCAVYVRVSTDDQRDNGYSIDSQLRMIKEYCEKNDYSIVDVYNDAGYSGKDLMRPEMQRLLADIKSKKIDKLIAIKVDRLTRNNYDGFWLLNYCEEHDVKIELILEPYDVSTANGKLKVYYHLRCKNHNCNGFGLHYNTEKIESKLKQILEELTIFMLSMDKEIITCNSTKSNDVKEIEKAIEKLKLQEKRLVDLYLNSNLDVETINYKNDVIKKEIDKLNKKKISLDPDNSSQEYTVELIKKLNCIEENETLIFTNIKNIGFTFLYDLLSRESKRDMIHRLVSQIEITRDKNYNIEIKNIKFTDEFITKSNKEYLKYLNKIMTDNNIGIKYQEEINKEKLKELKQNYDILSVTKMKNNTYSNEFLEDFISKSKEHLYIDGIISCPYVEDNKLNDILILVPKTKISLVN